MDSNLKEDYGIKYDQGKTEYHLIPKGALDKIAQVLSFGARKYEEDNWRKGFKYSRLYNGALRHINAWYHEREDNDPETGYSHLAHAICNLIFLMENYHAGDKNDTRPKANASLYKSRPPEEMWNEARQTIKAREGGDIAWTNNLSPCLEDVALRNELRELAKNGRGLLTRK